MTVQIIAKALLYDKSAESGLAGQVFKEDEKKRPLFISRITVPMVDYASDYTHGSDELSDAEPGHYILQLMLPNGNIITKDFEIKQGKTTEVDIEVPHEGSREWTALHAMKGQLRHPVLWQKSRFKSMLRKYRLERGINFLKSVPFLHDGKYDLTLLKVDKHLDEGILSGNQTISGLSQLIREDLDVKSAIIRFGTGEDVTNPTIEDKEYAVFKFVHSGVLKNYLEKPDKDYFDFRDKLSRRYLLQEFAWSGALTCLPIPWTMPQGQREVDLLIIKNSLADSPEMAMTVGDPMMNTVLGYINAGAIHQASELINLKQAKKMLYHKISCPFAATIGGYLLVFGLDRKRYRSESDNWKDWVGNLYRWFDWLPDGAVLYAALYFMLGELDRKKAYKALMRAYDRGLPFFTFGLKLMMDGMRYFAREKDAKARECLAVLETIADQTDPSQPFLTVTFSKHR